MKTLVVIPMKAPEQAKSRLGSVLDAAQRQSLALCLFDRTLRFFQGVFPQFDLMVVTESASIALRAHTAGALVLHETRTDGLNAAATLALHHALTHGYKRLMIVPADIPVMLRNEVTQLLVLSEQYQVVIAEARDGGTNMLLVTPPCDLTFQYGQGSALRHEMAAAAVGLCATRRYLPFIGHDIDTPADCLVLAQKKMSRKLHRTVQPLFEGFAR